MQLSVVFCRKAVVEIIFGWQHVCILARLVFLLSSSLLILFIVFFPFFDVQAPLINGCQCSCENLFSRKITITNVTSTWFHSTDGWALWWKTKLKADEKRGSTKMSWVDLSLHHKVVSFCTAMTQVCECPKVHKQNKWTATSACLDHAAVQFHCSKLTNWLKKWLEFDFCFPVINFIWLLHRHSDDHFENIKNVGLFWWSALCLTLLGHKLWSSELHSDHCAMIAQDDQNYPIVGFNV